MDIKRKLSNRLELRDQTEKRKELKELLNNFVKRNNQLGYCQDFSFMVNYLYERGLKKQEVFWLFTNIIENIMNVDYYSNMN